MQGGGEEERLPHLPQSLQSRALGFRSPSPLSRKGLLAVYLSLRLGIGEQKENAEERENFLQRGNVTGVL